MLRIVILVCILAAVLSALVIQTWLKSRRGHGENAARLYSIIRHRNSDFRHYQYLFVLITTAIIGVAVGLGTNWTNAAVYLVGAVICFASVLIGSASIVFGLSASAYAADTKDAPAAIRSSYRTGASYGFAVSAAGLLLLGLFVMLPFESSAVYLALGASTVAVFVNTGGNIYSSAYSLAVRKDDYTDVSGSFSGTGSDLIESYLLAGAAAWMLAEVGVATSGIFSTFTIEETIRFPLIIYAAGIVASVISTLFFRSGTKASSVISANVCCIITGILTAAVAFYFSVAMLQSRVYAYATASGIAAGLILAAVSRLFSSDSKLLAGHIKNDLKLGKYSPVIFNLGTGMICSIINVIVVCAALAVSINFASLYGIALCAVGLCSIAPAINAVSGLSIISGAASEITDSRYATEKFDAMSNLLDTVSVRSEVSSHTYRTVSFVLSSIAMLFAVSYIADKQSVNMFSMTGFSGIMAGVVCAPLLAGLIIAAVRLTGNVASNMDHSDDSESSANTLRGSAVSAIASIAMPALIGLFFGINVLIGFLAGSIISAFVLTSYITYSGQYFRNTAIISLGSLIKMMVVFSAAFITVFIRVGGFIL